VPEDPYAKTAKWYDRFTEPLARKMRNEVVNAFPAGEGISVLDIGCGTGTQLEIYQKAGCQITGVELSPAMLDVAKAKLGKSARLYMADGSQMPFPDESFDLIVAFFIIHEMAGSMRGPVMSEAKRVMKKKGRFLVIDYYLGPIPSRKGRLLRRLTNFTEFMAGGDHYNNFRDYVAEKGMPPLIEDSGLIIEREVYFCGAGIMYVLALG
jgi:demethylmenaquinone methyltransferase/2-methoxy-6-polyprenyl-1,4-benzoquinol methylase